MAPLEVFKVWCEKTWLKNTYQAPTSNAWKCIEHMSKTTPWRCRKCICPKCNICRIFGNIAIGVLNINILLLGKEGELWTKEHFESEAPLLGPTRSLYCMREKASSHPNLILRHTQITNMISIYNIYISNPQENLSYKLDQLAYAVVLPCFFPIDLCDSFVLSPFFEPFGLRASAARFLADGPRW